MRTRPNIPYVEQERGFLESVLRFANSRRDPKRDTSPRGFATDAAAYALLDPYGVPRSDGTRSIARLQESGAEAVAILEADQTRLRALLSDVVHDIRKARLTHGPNMDARLFEKRAFLIPRMQQGEMTFAVFGVEAAMYLALALLLDSARPFGEHLRVCALPDCDNHYLAFASGKGGRPSHYCSDAHRQDDNKMKAIERVAKWREQRARNTARKPK